MDNLNYTFSSMMERAMAMLGYFILAVAVARTIEVERERVIAALGHEPTQENLQYYYELQQDQKKRQTDRTREIDREKLRRLVLGEDDSDSKAR